MKTANEIRQEFINFFKDKYDHTVVKSAPVAPLDDPTLLFTNAGMNQFKDVFLGKGTRPYTRAVDSQKVIRASGKHNDLDDVGHDTYHHTFFEMLGNWSFGDYYKREAIAWAWELLTDVWGLEKDRLWATVYEDDHEAFEIWKEITDINPEHILYFDAKDNFWEMGKTGPCGPCSEIHYNLEPHNGISGADKDKGVNTDNAQFIEIWNLVFMQHFRKDSGELIDLPAKHVDTGMGFERIVSVLQDKKSNYDSDIFRPLIQKMEELCAMKYSAETEVPIRVAVDHIRSLAFSIADGALPSNEGRGYVLRRMLRRAFRYGRTIGLTEAFLYKLIPTVVKSFSDAYPELKTNEALITKTIRSEEKQFNRTLDKGLELFNELKEKLAAENKNEISGADVFKLYDTYGFPTDLTEILAKEHHLKIDFEAFEKLMDEQKNRAREASSFSVSHDDDTEWIILSNGEDSKFIGYDSLENNSEIRRYAIKDDTILFILNETPFYAESGGQVGDKGTITDEKNTAFEIIDVKKDGDAFLHIAKFSEIEPSSKNVKAKVEQSTRRLTANNHTATHLMHSALKKILGEHVQQAGSHVDDKRLRFDFNHFEKVTDKEIEEIERLVNQEIIKNTSLVVSHKSYDEAISEGITALFGEKYGDVVRVVSVSDYSNELCGGTHVDATGQIGSFQITSESSIATGVRRIEAITGEASFLRFQKQRKTLSSISKQLNTSEKEISDKISSLITDKKNVEKELNELREKTFLIEAKSWLNNYETINSIQYIQKELKNIDSKNIRPILTELIQNTENLVILIIAEADSKLMLGLAISQNLNKDLQAGKLVGDMAKIMGGGGGGRPDVATAGAKDLTKKNDAIDLLKSAITNFSK